MNIRITSVFDPIITSLRRGLTGWPQQGTAPEKVEMQMAHRLSPVLPAIYDETVAPAVQAFGRCDTGRGEHEFPCQIAVGILQFGQPCDVAAGNDQDVGRRLGVDVPESQELFIAMHLCAWYFACNDVAE